MWPRGWPIIQTKNSLHDAVERQRHVHRPGTAPIEAASVAIEKERYTEGLAEAYNCSGQMYCPCCEIPAYYLQSMPSGKLNNLLNVRRSRSVG